MIRRLFNVLMACILVLAVFAGWVFFGPATSLQADKYQLFIKTGMNFTQLMSTLQKDRVLKYPLAFEWLAGRARYLGLMKAGKYEIRKSMNLVTIVRMLHSGRQVPVNILIIKLRTKADFASLIGKKMECDSTCISKYLSENDSLRSYGLDTNTVMTCIFPDTYTFFWNTPPSRIFKKMFVSYNSFWTTDRIRLAKAKGLNKVTAYILASIVEEETGKQDDKGKIASVYLNRISRGMRLSADPTIKFALHNFELRRIYDKYLAVESPYNTYKYAGLPPGPICTPSRPTIDAVLTAPKSDYLYFVARPDFSGYSNFSSTYPEHLKFAKQYQQALNEQMRIAQQVEKK